MDQTQPSKTQRKQEMHALQALGERLVELADDQLARIDLPDALREAIAEAKRIRAREGLRRQMQYIGRLMREVDPVPIRAQLEVWRGRSRTATEAHHRAEQWRERLLADEAALPEFAHQFPHAELDALRGCLRAARAERLANKPQRHSRTLFRLIRDAIAVRDDAPI